MPIASLSAVAAERDTTASAEQARRTRFLERAGPVLDRSKRLAGLLLGNAHEAEDAVQDALVVACRVSTTSATPIASQHGSTGSWSTDVATGCVVARPCASSRSMHRSIPAGPDPFRDLIERDALLEGLSHLPPDERIVIVLRYWADLPLDGIADRMGWPLGSVKSRLHRALGRLRTGVSLDGTEVDR